MKSHFFSIAAVALSILAFAFTMPDRKPTATFDFKFIGSPTNASQIRDEPNYWEVYTGVVACNGINDKACQIFEVPEEYTVIVNGVRKMRTSVNIVTANGSGSNKYVSSTAPTTDIIINEG